MKDLHVIKQFQDWYEDRLNREENRTLQLHLEDCEDCERYFNTMKTLLEGTDSARLPHLEPDPFLPARIRAIAKGATGETSPARPALRAWPGRLGLSMMGLAFAVAAVTGTYFGSTLSARANASAQAADESIADAYYEAFSPSDISGEWEYILQDGEEENS